EKIIDFGRAEVARVDLDIVAPVEIDVREGAFHEFTNAVGFAGADDVLFGPVLLQHKPHGAYVIRSIAPVAARVQIAQVQLFLQAELDMSYCARDLAGDEGLSTARGFVVEQDAAGGVKS